MKTILALDSSGKTASVCVLRGEEILFEKTLDEGLTHSQTLLPLARQALAETGLTPAGVDQYTVTAGPGSFTGLRIGLSLVKGLALPFDTPALGVSTLEAHARGAGLCGITVPALDARRGEVYWAAFRTEGGFERLTPDAAGAVQSLPGALPFGEEPIFFVGDGAQLCYNVLNFDRVRPVPTGFTQRVALGAALAARAAGPGAAQPAAALEPCYLRLSQAERERAGRLAQEKSVGQK